MSSGGLPRSTFRSLPIWMALSSRTDAGLSKNPDEDAHGRAAGGWAVGKRDSAVSKGLVIPPGQRNLRLAFPDSQPWPECRIYPEKWSVQRLPNLAL